uniref:Uncharacterized protein n=1 Tax=Rhizophora mucronata TaxID=61149 RepID=A0A2P2MYZ2_RHIMU
MYHLSTLSGVIAIKRTIRVFTNLSAQCNSTILPNSSDPFL